MSEIREASLRSRKVSQRARLRNRNPLTAEQFTASGIRYRLVRNSVLFGSS